MRIGHRPPPPPNPRRREFVVGVPDDQFAPSCDRQRDSNWCWAACVQMVLNYHGQRVTQEEIVQHVFGREVNRPGMPEDILKALSDWDTGHGTVRVNSYAGPAEVCQELDAHRPLIVGLEGNITGATGHAYVLTAAYGHDSGNGPEIDRFVLCDPAPGRPNQVILSQSEFRNRCTFITRVDVEQRA